MVILKHVVLKLHEYTVVLDWNIQCVVFSARFITTHFTLQYALQVKINYMGSDMINAEVTTGQAIKNLCHNV